MPEITNDEKEFLTDTPSLLRVSGLQRQSSDNFLTFFNASLCSLQTHSLQTLQ